MNSYIHEGKLTFPIVCWMNEPNGKFRRMEQEEERPFIGVE